MLEVMTLTPSLHCASEVHHQASKRVIRYVKGTLDYGIMYSHFYNFKLHGYSNSDWAGFVDDIRRTSGYCFSFAMEFFHGVLKNKKL